MATASVTYTYLSNTPALASEVNTNFTNLVTFLNGSVIHTDGSKAMTGELTLSGNPTSSLSAASKAYVDAGSTITTTRVRRVANQTLSAATMTDISWDTEDVDTDGLVAVPSTTFTIPAGRGGVYGITVSGVWSASPPSTTVRVTAGGVVYQLTASNLTAYPQIATSFMMTLAAASTIVVAIEQTDSVSRNFTGRCEIFRLGA